MDNRDYLQARILLIDREQPVIDELSAALQADGYAAPHGIIDTSLAGLWLESADADLVVFDTTIPSELVQLLARRAADDVPLPALAIGESLSASDRERLVESGVRHFLPKPIDIPHFLTHVHSLLDARFAHLRLQQTRALLDELVQRRTSELKQMQIETLELLGRVAEVRDDATGQHTRRVGQLSGQIALEIHLAPEEAELIMRAAPLHDIGKVAIADDILLKSGGFGEDERKTMRNHVLLGAQLLDGARSDLLRLAREIAAYHHERWDGQGYPYGLKGEEIPMSARIVAVADAFDALTHNRPYKEAWSAEDALAEMRRESGWQFQPQVVDALIRVQSSQRRLQGTVSIRG